MSDINKPTEDFASSKWRPFMGWTYMFICLFDFCIGPVMNVAFSVITKTPLQVWKSLTLDNGGLFHLAMGAVLGVAAFGRTQEKVARMENGTASPPPMGAPPVSSYAMPPQEQMAPPMAPPPAPPMESPAINTETNSVSMTVQGDIPSKMRGRFR
jgi:hypothetical protein